MRARLSSSESSSRIFFGHSSITCSEWDFITQKDPTKYANYFAKETKLIGASFKQRSSPVSRGNSSYILTDTIPPRYENRSTAFADHLAYVTPTGQAVMRVDNWTTLDVNGIANGTTLRPRYGKFRA
jgi:hypothetical protein